MMVGSSRWCRAIWRPGLQRALQWARVHGIDALRREAHADETRLALAEVAERRVGELADRHAFADRLLTVPDEQQFGDVRAAGEKREVEGPRHPLLSRPLFNFFDDFFVRLVLSFGLGHAYLRRANGFEPSLPHVG